MKELKINHLAVWVAIVLLFVLGFIWYGPLFGDKWMGMVGVEADAKPEIGTWITNIIASVLPVYLLAWLYTKLKVQTLLEGLCYGFLISFVFVFLTRMTNDMFAQNTYVLSWIVGGFSVVGMSLAGLILGAWPKYKETEE